MPTPEYVWQKAEKDQIRRERNRLHKEGRIRNTSTPNVLVRDGERWKFPSPQG